MSEQSQSSSPSGLHSKLAAVSEAVEAIAKKGWNDHHGYAFITDSDVRRAVAPELAKRNVTMFHSVAKYDHAGDITTLLVKHEFTDADTGEQYSFFTVGQGQDKQDKGAAKAMTNAIKYALRDAFKLETDADPDTTTNSAPTDAQTPAQAPQRQQPANTSSTSTATSFTYPFGKSKGLPIDQVPTNDLQWFLGRPADTGKWAEKDAKLRAEMNRVLSERGDA